MDTIKSSKSLRLSSDKLGIIAHTYNPSIWMVAAGGSGVQDHPQLHGKLEASLGYLKLS